MRSSTADVHVLSRYWKLWSRQAGQGSVDHHDPAVTASTHENYAAEYGNASAAEDVVQL